MIMIWIFAIITFLITPGLAYADVPVFDGTTHTILRETKQLIDERTSILNQMIAGIFRKEIGISKSGAAEDPAIQEIIDAVKAGKKAPCEALGNSLDCMASKITAQSMRNLAAQYQDRLEGVKADDQGVKTPIAEPDGDPANTFTDGKFYVSDYGQYYANVATNEREIFLESTLGDDDPLQIKENLAPHLKDSIPQLVSKSLKTEDFEAQVKSTMPAGSEGFIDDFTQGGYEAWGALISPQNSPAFVYLSFLDEEQTREQAALAIAQEELNSPGIIPTKDCDYTDQDGKKLIGNCKITNPAGQNVTAFGQIPIVDRERAGVGDELSDIQEVEPKPGEGENVFIGPDTVVLGNEATRNNASLYDIDQLISLASRLIASLFSNTIKPKPTPTPTLTPTPTPPSNSVTINSPKNGEFVKGNKVISVDSTVPGPAAVQFKVDGVNFGAPVTGSGPYTITLNTDTLTEGAHIITATALNSNNVAIKTGDPITITVDRTAPAISGLNTSDNNLNIQGNTNITVNAADAGTQNLVAVEFFLNGISIGAGTLQNGLQRLQNWDSTAFGNGTYELSAVATDRAGNKNEINTPIAIVINN